MFLDIWWVFTLFWTSLLIPDFVALKAMILTSFWHQTDTTWVPHNLHHTWISDFDWSLKIPETPVSNLYTITLFTRRCHSKERHTKNFEQIPTIYNHFRSNNLTLTSELGYDVVTALFNNLQFMVKWVGKVCLLSSFQMEILLSIQAHHPTWTCVNVKVQYVLIDSHFY